MFKSKRRSTFIKEIFSVKDAVGEFKKLPEDIAKSLGKVLMHATQNGVTKPYTLSKVIGLMESKASFTILFPTIFVSPLEVVDGMVVVVDALPEKEEVESVEGATASDPVNTNVETTEVKTKVEVVVETAADTKVETDVETAVETEAPEKAVKEAVEEEKPTVSIGARKKTTK